MLQCVQSVGNVGKMLENVGRFPMASVNKNSGKGRDNRDRAHISAKIPKVTGSQILFHKILELSLISENCSSQVVSCDRQDVSADFLHRRSLACTCV